MQITIRKLDGTGDTVLLDKPLDEAVVAEAEAIVRQAYESRSMVFDSATKEKIDRGDYSPSEHPDALIVPAFQGG